MNFSKRVEDIEASKTVALSVLIQELKAQGKDIIALNVGEPDFSTPYEIKEATVLAIKEDKTKYDHVNGLEKLRNKIANHLNLTTPQGHPFKFTDKNILIANGSKQIIYTTMQTICNPGDEVIILKPYWVTFPESVKLAGGVPVFVETDQNHQIDFKALERVITSKTKAMIVNSPAYSPCAPELGCIDMAS